jgi:hypothetical protein
VKHVPGRKEKWKSYVKPENIAAQQKNIAAMQQRARAITPVLPSKARGPVPLGKREHAITPQIQRRVRQRARIHALGQRFREAV